MKELTAMKENKPRDLSSGALSISSYLLNFALFFDARTGKLRVNLNVSRKVNQNCQEVKFKCEHHIKPLVIAEESVVLP